jgi:hypothetical protein
MVLVLLPRAWRDRTRAQDVVVSDAGLQLDDVLVARDAISNAYLVKKDVTRLRVETHDAAYELTVPDTQARAATRALALKKRAMRLTDSTPSSPLGSLARLLGTLFLIGAGMAAFSAHIVAYLIAVVAIAIVVAASDRRRADVVVGIDGLSVVSRGAKRFVTWSDVRGVRVVGTCVVVDAESGQLKLNATLGRREGSGERAETLARWIARARTTWTKAPVPPRIEELGAGAFRTTHVADETLWQALRSARTPPDERVAAAMMLRARVADDDLPKIRVAADACADPVGDRIRAVLDSEDDAEDALANAKV